MDNTTVFSVNTTDNNDEAFDFYDLDSVLEEVNSFKTVSFKVYLIQSTKSYASSSNKIKI